MSLDRIHDGPAENGMTGWDYGAIIALATVGFSLSYDALRQIAVAIHVRPALSYFFPVVIDGFIGYGVRAIVLLRNRAFGARLYAWFLFLTATGASLWANALHAITLNRGPLPGRSTLHLGDGVVGVLSTLAPLALAGSVHLYILMARTTDFSSVRDRTDSGPGLVRNGVPRTPVSVAATANGPLSEAGTAAHVVRAITGPSTADESAHASVDLRKGESDEIGSEPVPQRHEAPSACPDGIYGGSDSGSGPPDSSSGARTDDDEEPKAATAGAQRNSRTVHDHPNGKKVPVPNGTGAPADRATEDTWLDELLPIARAASEQAGRISRDAVKHAVRAHQPIGNERLGVLIARLKQEEEGAATGSAGTHPTEEE